MTHREGLRQITLDRLRRSGSPAQFNIQSYERFFLKTQKRFIPVLS